MIGNDIISLRITEESPRSGNQRFLNKTLVPQEQEWVKTSADPEVALWSLWALKESAYKWAFRQNPFREFAPKKLTCETVETAGTNHVYAHLCTPQGTCYGEVWQTRNYLHAVVASSRELLAEIEWEPISLAETDPQFQSLAVRDRIKSAFNNRYAGLHFTRQKGVPIAHSSTGSAAPYLSISHHGNWGAYACLHQSGSL